MVIVTDRTVGRKGRTHLLTFWPPGPDEDEKFTMQAFFGMSSTLKVSIQARARSISSGEFQLDVVSARQSE